MAEAVNNPEILEDEDQFQEETFGERFSDWVRTEFVWYAGSFAVHLIGLSMLLLLGSFMGPGSTGDAPSFQEAAAEEKPEEKKDFEKFDVGEPEDTNPPELDVDPELEKPAREAQQEEKNDDSAVFEHKGGGTVNGDVSTASGGAGVEAFGDGPKVTGVQGIGSGVGTSSKAGAGGAGEGFGGRGSGFRKAMLAQHGGTKHTERAVTAALIWLARHQNYDGSWSLSGYTQKCFDKTCTGIGREHVDAGATALGLLPFLAAGQTHKTKGRYRETVDKAVHWLVAHQKPDGDLSPGEPQKMYSQGLATIALCEAYGLTGDKQVGIAAQGGVNYIMAAQNKTDGGWRYNPGDAGDTSVVGWEMMALKSAHMAGLNIGSGSTSPFPNISKWLDSVGVANGSQYCYQPGTGPSTPQSAVGLLCRQYLGAKKDNAMLTEGTKYLMGHLPDDASKNIYYWYYATQVLHNMGGYEWDTWNRKMRDLLVRTQNKDTEACSNGSWDPKNDAWGDKHAGRLYQTSLSTLTLEIYYRYLPLFKSEAGAENGGGAAAAAAPAEKAEAK
jgi:hypothetical protein